MRTRKNRTADTRVVNEGGLYPWEVGNDNLIEPVGPRLDHVSVAVRDLTAFERRFRAEFGLGIERFPGGGHVPLARCQYIEIHTPESSAALGAMMTRLTVRRDRWYGWSVEPVDFDLVVRERNLAPQEFGVDKWTRWSGQFAGTEAMFQTRGFLPYLIRYDQTLADREALFEQKRAAANHDVEPGELCSLVVGGPEQDLVGWVGGELRIVSTVDEPPGVVDVVVEVDGRPISLRIG